MPKEKFSKELPIASIKDRMALMAGVVAPTLAKGPLIRRPRTVRMAEKLGLDNRAVRVMARLRDAYGEGPLLVPIPGRLHALALSPRVAQRILQETPEPFSPATNEKRQALGHFEPHVSLVSTGMDRVDRRRFNEKALETGCPVHSLATPFIAAVEEEARGLLDEADGRLDWERFMPAWYAMVRRLILGRSARDDRGLTDLLARLRSRGNWVVLRHREGLIEDLRTRIRAHLERAEPGSLAERISQVPKGSATDPADQVAHWLFAFDPGGMATFRALALLAEHPAMLAEARDEAAEAGSDRAMLPLHRATLLESLRLWPTTPMILRQATRDVNWDGAVIPKDTNFLIYAPFLHRDPGLPFADRFTPELWLDEERGVRRAVNGPLALFPFSYGPGICPASDLVPMVGSAFLSTLVAKRTLSVVGPDRLRPDRPLPGTLDNYSLRFELRPR